MIKSDIEKSKTEQYVFKDVLSQRQEKILEQLTTEFNDKYSIGGKSTQEPGSGRLNLDLNSCFMKGDMYPSYFSASPAAPCPQQQVSYSHVIQNR